MHYPDRLPLQQGGEKVQHEQLSAEIKIKRSEFEKAIVALQTLTQPIKIGKKTQVTMDYDPQKPTVDIKYFTAAK